MLSLSLSDNQGSVCQIDKGQTQLPGLKGPMAKLWLRNQPRLPLRGAGGRT